MTTKLTKTLIETTALFPSGGIIMWSGSIASIPSGWVICDGTNSTPDLRNRFIVGAGSTYAVAATGGTTDAVVVSHTHTPTINSTSLTGSMSYISEAWDISGTADGVFTKIGGYPGQGTPNAIDVSNAGRVEFNGSHSHTASISTTGVSGVNQNLPPYYALAFIMKT